MNSEPCPCKWPLQPAVTVQSGRHSGATPCRHSSSYTWGSCMRFHAFPRSDRSCCYSIESFQPIAVSMHHRFWIRTTTSMSLFLNPRQQDCILRIGCSRSLMADQVVIRLTIQAQLTLRTALPLPFPNPAISVWYSTYMYIHDADADRASPIRNFCPPSRRRQSPGTGTGQGFLA
jgi:hypothetical protein